MTETKSSLRIAQVAGLGLLYLAAPLLVLFGFYVLDRPDQLSQDYRQSSYDWVRSFAERPPSEGWTALSNEVPAGRLPGEPFTSVWYRIPVTGDLGDPALYIPWSRGALAVWQNDRLLTQTAPMVVPLGYGRRGVVVPLQASAQNEANWVFVRLARQSSNSRIGYVYIAPRSEALRDAARLNLVQRHIPLVILTVMLSFAGMVGVMFVFRRQERAYLWYTLTVALWAGHSIHGMIESVPFHHFLWFASQHLLLNWLLAELYFVNRYFDIPAPRLERACTMVAVVAGCLLVGVAALALQSLRFEALYFALIPFFDLYYLLLAVVVTCRYFVAVLRHRSVDSVTLWLASGVVIGVGLRDFLFQLYPLVKIPGSVFYLQYVAIVPLVLFGVQLIRRFARDAHTAELRNRQLNALVDQRTEALAATYQKLTEEERKRALAEERSRLMRDMHDGLGGQLVGALALSERGDDADLQQSLRVALDDLRLIVDSLSPSADSLHDLLASYRYRMSRPLERSGFEVTWNVAPDTEAIRLRSDHALSVLRILQEAITNALRHSGGDVLTISLERIGGRLRLQVTDNGRGIPDDVVKRGLRNMQVRAQELGAELNLQSKPGATTVRVDLPAD